MSTVTAPIVAPLTSRDANTLVTAARRAAESAEVPIPIGVTVLDAGGHLLAFRRDDRAVLTSGETSTRLAYTALQLSAPAADPADLVKPDGALTGLPEGAHAPWPPPWTGACRARWSHLALDSWVQLPLPTVVSHSARRHTFLHTDRYVSCMRSISRSTAAPR